MSVSEVDLFLKLLLHYGVEAVIAGVVVFFLIKFFLPGYLSEKGKNLATKEDIVEITNQVERVRNQYAVLIEELKAKNQLRLAAIDRRLQAHQEAFTMWRALLEAIHTPEIGKRVIECNDWWVRNCLYLEPLAREAFANAYHAASNHASLLNSRSETKLIKESWVAIVGAGSTILQAVQLPGLTQVEEQELKRIEEKINEE